MNSRRFINLLGHGLDDDDDDPDVKFLVYPYMSNRDLSYSLFDSADCQSLDWITRLKIATEVAAALSYLHHECSPPLVHGDVQASSILLGDKFEVRISEEGSSGIPHATCPYDVYCFGKVLLELVTGKLGISSSTDAAMKEFFEETLPYISIYDKELVTKIVDQSLIIDEDHLDQVWAMAIVARSCFNPMASRRPLMRYILKGGERRSHELREASNYTITWLVECGFLWQLEASSSDL